MDKMFAINLAYVSIKFLNFYLFHNLKIFNVHFLISYYRDHPFFLLSVYWLLIPRGSRTPAFTYTLAPSLLGSLARAPSGSRPSSPHTDPPSHNESLRSPQEREPGPPTTLLPQASPLMTPSITLPSVAGRPRPDQGGEETLPTAQWSP